MASVLDKKTSIDWDKNISRARFPWDEWTDGQTYQAVQGVDFQSGPYSFTQQLRKKAEKLDVEVKTRVEQENSDPSIVFFQFGGK